MTAPFPLPDIVLKDLRGTAARDILRALADALDHAVGIDAAGLTVSLLEAEGQGGSAIGDGVAVVSARVPASLAPRRICAFATLARPVSFKGIEQHACDAVFVMVAPEEETQSYLRDLSTVIRALRDADFIERLRTAENAERAAGLFRARDMAMAKAA